MQSQNPIPVYPSQSGTIGNSSSTIQEELKETKHSTIQQSIKTMYLLTNNFFFLKHSFASISDKAPGIFIGKDMNYQSNHGTHTFPLTAKNAKILSNFLAKPQTVINSHHILTNQTKIYNLLQMNFLSDC